MFRASSLLLASSFVFTLLAPQDAKANDYEWIAPLSTKAERARIALEGFDSVVEKALSDYNVPGLAIGVVVDGQVVMAKGYGYRDVEKQLPVTPDTIFPIGSPTKGFATFLMGMMIEEGLFEWDTAVIDVLPEFRLYDQYATQNLTLRDLVTHRSGLPRHDFSWYNSGLSRTEILKKLRYLEPTCDIRERFNYNSLMYMVAGMAMERVGKKSWEQLTTEKILKPLGMNSTCFSVSDLKGALDAATPYIEKKGQLKRMNLRNISSIGPGGAMNSTVNDMNLWLKMLLNQGIYNGVTYLSPATLQEIQAPQVIVSGYPENKEAQLNAYGLGWGIVSYRGHYYVSHDGGIDGFTSVASLFPQDGVGVFVVTNKNLNLLSRMISLEAIDRVLELPSKDWVREGLEQIKKGNKVAQEAAQRENTLRKKNTTPSHDLSEFVGTYEEPGYGVVKVELIDGKLHATYNNITAKLDHWHYDVFSVAEESEDLLVSREGLKYTFRNNVNGEIEDLTIPFESNSSDIVFKKKAGDEFSNLEYFRQFTGKYEIYGVVAEITIRDRALLAIIPGQPVFELLPIGENEFVVKSMTHYMIRFVKGIGGEIEEALLILPYGAFSATPKR